MGREIKRVALDFNWPMSKVWEGYVYPPDGTSPCVTCHRTGYSRMGMALDSLTNEVTFLPNDSSKLTSSERTFMYALEKAVDPEQFASAQKHYGPDYLPYVYGGGRSQCTNARTLVYDLMKHLSSSLGLSMEETFLCSVCKGSGNQIVDKDQHEKAEQWTRTEPPAGEGWQVWETVSEGSPITPVFATSEALVDHLCTKGTHWKRPLPTREAAEAFVKSGWVTSMVMITSPAGETRMYHDIESAVLQDKA